MSERHGVASYPGIIGVISTTYTNSHGITPGQVRLVCQMQNMANVPNIGDCIITDGIGAIPIPGCRITQIVQSDSPPWTLSLFLEDRRWRWTDFGIIAGVYNQPDPRGKFIPWTIRSPHELAEACLSAMNEVDYTLNLPPGLDRAFGLGVEDWLQVGQVFPQTGTNPPVNWDAEVPAHVLQRLAELFGCHIIYDVINNRVLITPIGTGAILPDGHIARFGPSIKSVAIPDGIMVVGAPTKYQARLATEAVGKEWDGTFQPIDQLSYAPVLPGQNQITTVTFGSATSPFAAISGEWTLTVRNRVFVFASTAGDTPATVATNLFTGFNAALGLPQLNNEITATLVGSILTFTGTRNDVSFPVTATFTNANGAHNSDGCFINIRLMQASQSGVRGWTQSDPLSFEDVISTDRLTYRQAIDLAKDFVYKAYRLKNIDVSGKGQINIPGYGLVERRQQILLTPTMVEQVTPALPNMSFRDPRNEAPGNVADFIQNFYDGFSRDKPAICYGSFSEPASGIEYLDSIDGITPGDGIIQIPFEIEPVQQLVKFNEQIYTVLNEEYYVPGAITIETGVNIRDRETNQLIAFTLRRPLETEPGQTVFGDEISRRDDVKLGVIGRYQFEPVPSTIFTVPGRRQTTYVSFNGAVPTNNNKYMSIQNANTGHMVTDTAWWIRLLSDPEDFFAYSGLSLIESASILGMLGDYPVNPNDCPLDFASTLTLTLTDANASITAGTVNIKGKNANGANVQENIVLPNAGGTATYTTQNSYKLITTVTGSAFVGVGPGDAVTLKITRYPMGVLRVAGGSLYLQRNPAGSTGVPGFSVDWLLIPFDGASAGFYSAAQTYIVGHYVQVGFLAGTIFTVNINGVPFVYTTVSGDVLETIPGKFRDLINASVNAAIINKIRAFLPQPVTQLTLRGLSNAIAFPVTATIMPGANVAIGLTIVVTTPVSARTAYDAFAIYNSIITGQDILEADPIFRANYYLDMMMRKYQIAQAQTVEYNGIVAISCDGAISQVTWSIGDGKKASTIASRNCEHSTYLPPYPARRRAENLRPAQINQMLPGDVADLFG